VKNATTKPVRCAIYTRVSTDHGLEQDFASTDRPALQRLLSDVKAGADIGETAKRRAKAAA